MKYSVFIKDYFSFNQKELRGIFVLLTLILLVLLANVLVPRFVSPGTIDMSSFDKEIRLFVQEMHRQDSLEEFTLKKRYNKFPAGSFPMRQDSVRGLHYPGKEMIRIELNSADTFSLQQLRGIGPGFARRIIRYRDRLGGFISKRQVLEVFGMDTARYNGIAASLFVNTDSIHKINLNTVTFKQLLAHPYFPFEITKAIMLYRKDKKKIVAIDELRTVKGMTDTTFRKIQPYIKTE